MNIIKKILAVGKLFGGSKKNGKPNAKNGSRRGGNGRFANEKSERKSGRGSNFERRKTDARNAPRGRGGRRPELVSPSSVKPRAPKQVPAPMSAEVLAEKVPEFAALGLGEKTLSAIADMGYVSPTPIQKLAIPVVLKGSDVIGTAQTGTGKTAAFALPIVDKLSPNGTAQVLVLSPTRELATQTAAAFDNFSKYSDIETALVQGGVNMDAQIRKIASGADVIVATPGRLLDHISRRTLSLKTVKYLVLDEVDRMFDMGFIEDVSNIIRYCPKCRQTLFFSATMPDEVLRLSKWALKDPENVGVGIVHSPADTIEHFIYPVDGIQKYDMLIEILKKIDFSSLIVFTRTRMDADRISQWLEGHDYPVSTLHSDRTQRERDKALEDFKSGRNKILVATDIASRGLDISNVSHVINYNVPEHSEDYVHRIGRTGRANHEGMAITLYSSEETEFLKRIEAFIGAKIERRALEGFPYRNPPVLHEEAKRPHKRNR